MKNVIPFPLKRPVHLVPDDQPEDRTSADVMSLDEMVTAAEQLRDQMAILTSTLELLQLNVECRHIAALSDEATMISPHHCSMQIFLPSSQ
ncbi:hypothetical protein ACWGMK_12880 [Agrobacterium deltaense]